MSMPYDKIMNPEYTDDYIRFTQFNSELFNLLNSLVLLNSLKVFIAPKIDFIIPKIGAN